MGVHLRIKPLKNGKQSLYLDFYPPIVNPATNEKTRREFLRLYIYDKPKTVEEKMNNKESMIKGQEICAIRQRQIFNEELGIYSRFNKKKDFLKYFFELTEKKNEQSSKGNYSIWMSVYKFLVRFTNGECKISDINEQFCKDFRDYLLNTTYLNSSHKKLKINAAQSYFKKFKSAINQAFEDRLITENYILRINGITQEETNREFVTIEELSNLYKAKCEIPKLKEACLFSALTGLRWSDVRSLKWDDIQKSKDMGYFIYKKNLKTNANDHHPISKQAVNILGNTSNKNELIFEGLNYNVNMNKHLKQWVVNAGINKKITFHNFRHSYATILLSNGIDIATVSKMLNHKNIKTTMIYAKVMGQAKKDAANSINIEL